MCFTNTRLIFNLIPTNYEIFLFPVRSEQTPHHRPVVSDKTQVVEPRPLQSETAAMFDDLGKVRMELCSVLSVRNHPYNDNKIVITVIIILIFVAIMIIMISLMLAM